MSDYERKKSWREIDKMSDGSQHRKRQETPQKIASTKRYKSSLDRLFDSGKVGKLVEKLEAHGKAAPASRRGS